jgi:hypothetical protein
VALAVTPGCDNPAGPPVTDSAADDPPADAAAPDDLEHLRHPPADPRAALEAALASGALPVGDDPKQTLAELLRLTGVPEASQVLVFSKTSMQSGRISPNTPRAIYFSDDYYVGYVPGGLIEISDAHPEEGTGFYALDPRPLDRPSTLESPVQCLNCHLGSRTNYAPGLLVRSVYADEDGFPIGSAGSFVTGHDSPFEERWGGWYVTGRHGTMRHMGNAFAEDLGQDAALDTEAHANRTDLDGLVDTSRYLAPGSDVAALLILEHQVQMHNRLTQGTLAVRKQLWRSRRIAESDGSGFDPYRSETLMSVVSNHAEKIVAYLLFRDEFALTDTVRGDRAFVRQFRANRREAADGRSLKDLDLRTRLLTYRCSYMIYSQAFEQMPPLLKEAVYARLYDALSGPDTDLNRHLPADERAAILTILRDTKDGLPDAWR